MKVRPLVKAHVRCELLRRSDKSAKDGIPIRLFCGDAALATRVEQVNAAGVDGEVDGIARGQRLAFIVRDLQDDCLLAEFGVDDNRTAGRLGEFNRGRNRQGIAGYGYA